MFLHPTLRNITLSCLNFEADMILTDDIVVEKQKSTPLRSLTLIECNVDIQFLDVVLSLPKSLKELSISERLYTFPECEPSMEASTRTSSTLFLDALNRQAESLQRLTHVGGSLQYLTPRQTDPHGAAKVRALTGLEHLELGFESHLYYYLRNGGSPPSLKSLKMLDAAISLNAGHNVRATSDIAFRSITSLVTHHLPWNLHPGFIIHLHYSDHSIFRLYMITHPAEQTRLLTTLFLDRPAIYSIANALKSYRAHFEVSRDTFPSGTAYIPPYMYGEELPVEEKMYDSRDYWRFSGIDYQVIDDEALRNQLKGKQHHSACVGCTNRGIPLHECRKLPSEASCLPCVLARMDCRWDEDDEEGEEGEYAGQTHSA